MQNSVKSFGLWPVVMMTLLTVGLVNHVIVIPLLLDAAKRDAWLSVPISLIIALPIAAFPLHRVLIQLKGKRLDQWMNQRAPRFIAWIVMAIILITTLIVAFGALIDVVSWTSTTYLPKTPPIVTAVVFCCVCLFAAVSGLRTIAYVSCILLPIVVFLGDFVMSANMPVKDYHFLLPMLENGISPVLQGTMYSLTALMELTYLLLIQHHLRGQFKKWHLMLLTVSLVLLTIGPTIGAITEFGPVEAELLRFPAFSQWRMVRIGKYFEHVDFFAVFQWLSGALIRMSVTVYLIQEYGPLRHIKRPWIGITATFALLVTGAYYMLKDMLMYRRLISYYFASGWIVLLAILLLLWGLSFKKITSKQGNRGERNR